MLTNPFEKNLEHLTAPYLPPWSRLVHEIFRGGSRRQAGRTDLSCSSCASGVLCEMFSRCHLICSWPLRYIQEKDLLARCEVTSPTPALRCGGAQVHPRSGQPEWVLAPGLSVTGRAVRSYARQSLSKGAMWLFRPLQSV